MTKPQEMKTYGFSFPVALLFVVGCLGRISDVFVPYQPINQQLKNSTSYISHPTFYNFSRLVFDKQFFPFGF